MLRNTFKNRVVLTTHLSPLAEFEYAKTALALGRLVDVNSVIAVAEKAIEDAQADYEEKLGDQAAEFDVWIDTLCDRIDRILQDLKFPPHIKREKLIESLENIVESTREFVETPLLERFPKEKE